MRSSIQNAWVNIVIECPRFIQLLVPVHLIGISCFLSKCPRKFRHHSCKQVLTIFHHGDTIQAVRFFFSFFVSDKLRQIWRSSCFCVIFSRRDKVEIYFTGVLRLFFLLPNLAKTVGDYSANFRSLRKKPKVMFVENWLISSISFGEKF